MKPALAPTVRVVSRTILASSIASLLLAGAAHAVSWPAGLPPGGVLTLGVDLGGDDVDLLADTVVTLDGAGGTLLENIIVNLGTASVTTLTVNNAAGAARTLAANSTVLGGDNGKGLVVAGSADFRIGAVSDGGFANMELVKNGGLGELILDNLNNDLDGATLRVVSGTVSIEGGGGTASPIDSLLNAIRIDGAAAKLRLGTLTAPGTTFNNNLVVNDSGTLEHTAASHDTLSGLVSLAASRTLTANVTNGSLTLSGSFTRAGSSNLTKTGAGTLYLSGFGSGTGLTNVNAGTLQYAIPGALYAGVTGSWTAANIIVESGATLAVNVGGAGDFTTGNVTTLLTGLSTVNNNGLKAGSAFGFDTTNAVGTVSYASAITNSSGPGGGAVGITKLGLGTLSLGGVSTYTDATTISTGTLALESTASINNSSGIAVAGGATYDVAAVSGYALAQTLSAKGTGTANVTGGVTAAARTIDLQDGSNIGTLAFGSTLTLSGATLRFDLGESTSDRITVGGVMALSGTNIINVAALASATSLSIGTQAYTLITAASGLVNSSFSLSSTSLTIEGTTYVFSLSGDATNEYLGVALASAAVPTTYTLTTSASAHSIRAFTGTSTITTTLTNTGTTAANSDSLAYTTLGGTVVPGAGYTLDAPAAGGTIAANASGTASAVASQTFSNAAAGSYSVTASGGVVTNASLGGPATLQGSVGTDTINVYRLAAANTIVNSVTLANVHVGDTFGNSALTITNTAANDGFSEGLNATPGNLTGVASAVGTISNLTGSSTAISVSLGNTTTAGARTGMVDIQLASSGSNSGLGDTGLATQTVTVSGNVFRLAAPATNLAGMPVDLGRVRVNGTFGTAPLSISNTALADGFSEGLNAAFGTTDGASHNSGTIGNLAAGATNGASLAVGLGGSAHTGTAGVVSGTVTLALVSNGTASGLPDTNLTPEIITVTGFVYSGLGTWNLDGGGNWSTIANWQANGGVPGLDAGFTATDTATFGGSAISTNPTVSLNGVSPNLKALTFDNASQSYTLNASGGGILKLDNAAGIATVTDSNGDHIIGAPIELASDVTFSVANSGDVLRISGNITQSGTHGLTKTGSGTLNLTGVQSYATLTSTAGTTNVDGVIGSGGASVTVNSPGTVLKFGSVSQTLSSLSIGAGATVIFTSGAASLSGGTAKAAGLGDGAVVPEPGTLGLLMVGVLGILGRRRRTP